MRHTTGSRGSDSKGELSILATDDNVVVPVDVRTVVVPVTTPVTLGLELNRRYG
jgi:hypothetical protein